MDKNSVTFGAVVSLNDLLSMFFFPPAGEVLNQFRSITRQYAYFFKLFQVPYFYGFCDFVLASTK